MKSKSENRTHDACDTACVAALHVIHFDVATAAAADAAVAYVRTSAAIDF